MTEYSGGEMDTRIAGVKRETIEMVFKRLEGQMLYWNGMDGHWVRLQMPESNWKPLKQELLKEVA